MRNLLLLAAVMLMSAYSFAQSPCSHSFTWTNVSTSSFKGVKLNISSAQMTGVQKKYIKIYWGNGTSFYNFFNGTSNTLTSYYSSFGNYNIKVVVTVVDSTNQNVICADSSTATAVIYSANPCNALFSTTYDTAQNGNVTFSITTPPSSSNMTYNWSFGDGSTGTGSTITHNYAQYGPYNVTVYVNNGTCTGNRSVTIYPFNSCHGIGKMMTWTVNTSTLTAVFATQSQHKLGCGKHMYYQWDFGDGNSTGSSMGNANISHTYGINGVYYVSLITKLVDSVTNATLCVDTVYRNVQVGQSNIMAGFIKRDTTTLPVSADYKVWLIEFDSATNTLTAVDSFTTSSIYEHTYFAFQYKVSGKYRLKAAITNNPTTGTVHIPTYSDSSLLWSNANVVVHTQSTAQANIYMRTGAPVSGPGFIGGNVLQGANKGTANGIEGMNILLLDVSDNVISYAITDANGEYSFPSLPTGKYKVHPEDMNYTTTPVIVDITNNKLSHNAVYFERSKSQMTIVPVAVGVTDVNNKALAFSVYPNPAKDVVAINWATHLNSEATVFITDISGKKVKTIGINMSTNAVVDVSELQPGFYFMNVVSEMGNATQKLIIQ